MSVLLEVIYVTCRTRPDALLRATVNHTLNDCCIYVYYTVFDMCCSTTVILLNFYSRILWTIVHKIVVVCIARNLKNVKMSMNIVILRATQLVSLRSCIRQNFKGNKVTHFGMFFIS